jgi:molybdopterin-binding protein
LSALLEVEHLVVQRGGQSVLSVDSLTVQEGEVLAVIGPNGAGKSTLMLVLSRLLRPQQASIHFRGRRLEEIGDLPYRRRIALVLQESLLLDVSVYQNVAMGMRFRGLPRNQVQPRVDAWLERLGIAHLRKRSARRLSGGEAQRVSLARAFAIQPDLLMLDEPFSALDAPTRLRLMEDFQSLLAETRLTTVFITHDRDEAIFLGDRVAVLLEGGLRQVGTPQEVFTAPLDPQVAAFVGVETILPGEVIASQEGHLVVEANGERLEAAGQLPVGRKVYFCLRPEDVTLWGNHEREFSVQSSARNRLNGTVQRMIPQGALYRVVVDCGVQLVALVTRATVQEMALEPGLAVRVTFKASAVHIISR